MLNYTFIIPHKNTPELLRRCIDSIPKRNDVEIIIVDDNSDATIINFDNFLCSNNSNVKVVLTKEGLGAGYARNKGLEIAKGRWLVFADSDDYFISDKLSEMMDCYANSSVDIVYFNVECLYADSLTPAPNADKQYKQIVEGREAETMCRYKLKVPWGKFVKRDFVMSNGIRFDETKVANDRMFSLRTGILASLVEVNTTPIYVWLVRKGSLTTIRSKECALLHFYVAVNANKMLDEFSLGSFRGNLFMSFPNLRRGTISNKEALSLIYHNTPRKYLIGDFVKALIMYVKKSLCDF